MASIYLLDQTSDRSGQTKPVFVYEIRAEDYLIETHKIRVRDTKNAMTSACDDGYTLDDDHSGCDFRPAPASLLFFMLLDYHCYPNPSLGCSFESCLMMTATPREANNICCGPAAFGGHRVPSDKSFRHLTKRQFSEQDESWPSPRPAAFHPPPTRHPFVSDSAIKNKYRIEPQSEYNGRWVESSGPRRSHYACVRPKNSLVKVLSYVCGDRPVQGGRDEESNDSSTIRGDSEPPNPWIYIPEGDEDLYGDGQDVSPPLAHAAPAHEASVGANHHQPSMPSIQGILQGDTVWQQGLRRNLEDLVSKLSSCHIVRKTTVNSDE
ncbi:unnamed protein product [Fusarium graminearum]|nr:unnamed protein product [Fusarium graminearum]